MFYTDRLKTLSAERKKLLQKKSIFGILRLGSIAALIALFYFLWAAGPLYVAGTAVLLIIIFIQLIYKDLANRAAISNLTHLIKINEDEIKAVNGSYFHFDDGALLAPKDHYYANDMDIFGHASLYQFINRSTSQMGAAQLAQWLLKPSASNDIMARQQAIKELKEKATWRQQLQAFGKQNSIKNNTKLRLQEWLMQPTLFLQFRHWQWLCILLPAIILFVTAGAVFSFIPMNVFYGSLLLYGIIAYQINKIVAPLHEQLSKMVNVFVPCR